MSLLTQLAYTSSYNYNSQSYSTADNAAAAGVMMGMLMLGFLLAIACYVFTSFCLMKIFKKAGREDTWAAWVPVYQMWVLFEIAGRPGWWVLSMLIPFVGGILFLIVSIIAYMDVAKSFGKDTGFAVLLILVPIVGFPMLAFSDATYNGPAGPERATTATPGAVPAQESAPTTAPSQPEAAEDDKSSSSQA